MVNSIECQQHQEQQEQRWWLSRTRFQENHWVFVHLVDTNLKSAVLPIVREYVFYVFFWKSKKRDFLRFFEAAFLKNVKNALHNSKFQTLLTFHYMEFPLQLKNNVLFIIYTAVLVAYKTTNVIECGI